MEERTMLLLQSVKFDTNAPFLTSHHRRNGYDEEDQGPRLYMRGGSSSRRSNLIHNSPSSTETITAGSSTCVEAAAGSTGFQMLVSSLHLHRHHQSICAAGQAVPLHGCGLACFSPKRALSNTACNSLQSCPPADTQTSEFDLVLNEGFSQKQAQLVLKFYTIKHSKVSIRNVRGWLTLLLKHHVDMPVSVISKYPLVLSSKYETADANADAFMLWCFSLGLTPVDTALLLSKRPMLLVVPHATAAAASEWLSKELGWSSAMIGSVLVRNPRVLSASPNALSRRLAWFQSQGFSVAAISKAFYSGPTLFNYSIIRNEAQLSAMQAMGLSQSQVGEMLGKMPMLLARDMSSAITQAKLRFLIQVMGKPVLDMVTCPGFLCISLLGRTGPRWFFCSLYCHGQAFVLSTNLIPTDEQFVKRLSSPSLDADCAARDLSRIQLYNDFKISWVDKEGLEWDAKQDKPNGAYCTTT